MAASSAVPEYRLRLPYVPRAIFKPYHARQQTAGIEVELAEAVEQVAAALLAEVGAHGNVAAAQADPKEEDMATLTPMRRSSLTSASAST